MTTPLTHTITLTLTTTDGGAFTGFRWFWAKVVRGFQPAQHCAKCLVGSWVPNMGPTWLQGEDGRVTVQVPEGAFLYVCGVANPYCWSKNFHMALTPSAGTDTISHTYNNASVLATNAAELPIPAEPAAVLYPERDRSFLTCRNFQFGAAYFGSPHSRSRG
jgi:hypothetical protein